MALQEMQLPCQMSYGSNFGIFNSGGSCGEDGVLPFDSDILDDLITKNDNELPLDIRGFQPSPLESPASQNPCDVINHLHGDHQRPDHQQEMQKSPPSCSQGSPDDPQANYMRQKANGAGFHQHSPQTEDYMSNGQMYNDCSPSQANQEPYNINRLPDSPPDSSSEAQSPPQMNGSPPDQYMQQRMSSYSQQGGSPYHGSPHYDRTPTDTYPPRMHNTNMNEFNAAPNNPHCSAMGSMYGGGGAYERPDPHRAMSSLSPGSCTSDSSMHSNPGMGYITGPASKKRKHSEHHQPINQMPQQLNPALLNHQFRGVMQQTVIKQEPGPMTSPRNGLRCPTGYFNEAYDLTDERSAAPQMPVPPQLPLTISGSSRIGDPLSQDIPLHNRTPPLSSGMIPPHYGDNMAYQVIKWRPFLQESWHPVYDRNKKELQTVSYRVDADKGFNFAVADDAFVCQKKNHFQVTVHIGVIGHPHYIKTDDGLKQLDAFHLNLYGVKYESQNQTIAIEQSQSDRSKKPFHPVKVDLPGDQVTKVTIGRLHFSETTTNNMRKKGRPNPDQRYFMCIVALHGQTGGKSYTIAASGTDKIIVRASNPGQFDQDDVLWQRAQIPDAIYHHGRVGINYDHPDEALVVHGNVKVTGHVMNPSDRRAKHAFQEVDTSTQLKNVQNIRLWKYRYSPEYAMYAGIDTNREETGVIAQEFAEVLPDAVKDTGEVKLPNGEVIPNFLVVDKDRLYMENVGAVKELCRVTGNFEERIDELERWNKKLSKLKMYDSFRSTASVVSGYSSASSTPSVSRQGSTRKTPNKKSSTTRNHHRSQRSRKSAPPVTTCWSNKAVVWSVVGLVVLMALSVISMPIIYGVAKSGNENTGSSNTVESGGKANTTSAFLTTSTITSIGKTTTVHSTQPSTAPVDYCPPETMCTDDHCCSTPTGGVAVVVACSRDMFYNFNKTAIIQKFKNRYGSKYPYYSSPNMKMPFKGDSKQTSWRDKYDDYLLRQWSRQFGSVSSSHKEKYMYEEPDFQHPSLHKIHASANVDSTREQKTKPKIARIGRAKTKPNSPRVSNIDENYDINPETIKHPILRRPKRSADPLEVLDHQTIADVNQIILVQPNITLYDYDSDMKENYRPYLSCDGHHKNFTFNIPVAPSTPPDIPIRIQFNMKSQASVILCALPEISSSPCPHKVASIEELPTGTAYTGKVVYFDLYFSSFVNGSYKFRISTSMDAPTEICEEDKATCGYRYTEYLFHFYRTCNTDDSSTAGEIDESTAIPSDGDYA